MSVCISKASTAHRQEGKHPMEGYVHPVNNYLLESKTPAQGAHSFDSTTFHVKGIFKRIAQLHPNVNDITIPFMVCQ